VTSACGTNRCLQVTRAVLQRNTIAKIESSTQNGQDLIFVVIRCGHAEALCLPAGSHTLFGNTKRVGICSTLAWSTLCRFWLA